MQQLAAQLCKAAGANACGCSAPPQAGVQQPSPSQCCSPAAPTGAQQRPDIVLNLLGGERPANARRQQLLDLCSSWPVVCGGQALDLNLQQNQPWELEKPGCVCLLVPGTQQCMACAGMPPPAACLAIQAQQLCTPSLTSSAALQLCRCQLQLYAVADVQQAASPAASGTHYHFSQGLCIQYQSRQTGTSRAACSRLRCCCCCCCCCPPSCTPTGPWPSFQGPPAVPACPCTPPPSPPRDVPGPPARGCGHRTPAGQAAQASAC
jgi:hypothetical protein